MDVTVFMLLTSTLFCLGPILTEEVCKDSVSAEEDQYVKNARASFQSLPTSTDVDPCGDAVPTEANEYVRNTRVSHHCQPTHVAVNSVSTEQAFENDRESLQTNPKLTEADLYGDSVSTEEDVYVRSARASDVEIRYGDYGYSYEPYYENYWKPWMPLYYQSSYNYEYYPPPYYYPIPCPVPPYQYLPPNYSHLPFLSPPVDVSSVSIQSVDESYNRAFPAPEGAPFVGTVPAKGKVTIAAHFGPGGCQSNNFQSPYIIQPPPIYPVKACDCSDVDRIPENVGAPNLQENGLHFTDTVHARGEVTVAAHFGCPTL